MLGQHGERGKIEELSAEIQRIDPEVERIQEARDLEVAGVRASQGSYSQMLLERFYSKKRWENRPATGWSVDVLDAAKNRHSVPRPSAQ